MPPITPMPRVLKKPYGWPSNPTTTGGAGAVLKSPRTALRRPPASLPRSNVAITSPLGSTSEALRC
eukprot:3030070-Prymnesium_polylepis.1